MLLMKNNIEDRIRNIMSAVFRIPVKQIHADSSPKTIEAWDSLKHITLVMALEEEFSTEISDDDAEKLTTVGKTVTYIVGHLK